MHDHQLKGLIVPLPSPMTPDGDLDDDSLATQVRRVLSAGADGVWTNGSTAEFHALTPAQQLRNHRTAVEIAKTIDGAIVVGQVGAPATAQTISNAEAAAHAGVDALAVITPYYTVYSPFEIIEHYRAVRSAVDLPLLVYHVPRITGVNLSIDLILDLAAEGVIQGIKDSTGDIGFARRMRERALERGIEIANFTGSGALVSAFAASGGSGAMCAISNLIPGHVKRLLMAQQGGNLELAWRMQSEIISLENQLGFPGIPRWSASIAIYKFVLFSLGVIQHQMCAAPLQQIPAPEAHRLQEAAVPLIEKLEHSSQAAIDAR